MGKLESLKDIDLFSWYLFKKMKDKTVKPFKLVRCGKNNLVPMIISDKVASFKAKDEENNGSIKFYNDFAPIG